VAKLLKRTNTTAFSASRAELIEGEADEEGEEEVFELKRKNHDWEEEMDEADLAYALLS
jgi:uncharacterized protein YwgA